MTKIYYCNQCGSVKLTKKIPKGDTHFRIVCEECNYIHYQNPKVITSCLPIWADKILLCKRAIEPCLGFWTLPGGYMENDENLEESTIRETWEEAGATVKKLQLYLVISHPHRSVSMTFLGQLNDLTFAPGIESLDVRLFSQQEIPWKEIAF